MSAYLHALEGRLRIKLSDVKGSSHDAREVAHRMRGIRGVERATANPLTGNLLVVYDAAETHAPELLDALRRWGYLRGAVRWSSPRTRGDGVGAIVARTTAQFALQRLLGTLIY